MAVNEVHNKICRLESCKCWKIFNFKIFKILTCFMSKLLFYNTYSFKKEI